jgi:hypothetical protein
MKKIIWNRALLIVMLLVSAFAFAACGDDEDDTPVDNSALVGTWRLNHATAKANAPGMGEITIRFTSTNNTVDVTAQVGNTTIPIPDEYKNLLEGVYGEIIFAADKTYRSYEFDGTEKSLSESGNYNLSGNKITINNGTDTFIYNVSMNGSKQVTFDFQESSNAVVKQFLTSLSMTLDKQ